MKELNKFQTIDKNELQEVQGGGIVFGVVALISSPFILGAIAGGADEYARKKGHR
ncbi:class IIb bacteriocin, lactobin A/cerein 7B family (plasmid) [Streptococcus suis]|uniref:Blp family class II bacteriocin n=1 Tax=Streptococcus suis TaxID=1307 RepID=UPI00211C7224|nr:class IIb bacteriocin, lactobin A/cerein 7B family [Streptococcus suis]UUM58893.1 class IIb bacteriocin, lactobin A/cerein 7B family [Streptococcus suis]UUM63124.1 class IIb bacteriocin, lactobin A/cerein 7B family [Streptococcus suis]